MFSVILNTDNRTKNSDKNTQIIHCHNNHTETPLVGCERILLESII